MKEIIVLAGIPCCAFVATVLLQLLLWRATPMRGLFAFVAIAAACFFAAAALVLASSAVSLPDAIGFGIPLFAFLVLAYLHLYVGLYRSLSVRILGELWEAGGVLSDAELDDRYPLEWMFSSRLELLVRKRWLEERDGKYRCRPKARVVASAYSFLRNLYGVRQAG